VTSALARSLLLADAVTREALAEALLVSASRGTSLVRALLATGAIKPSRLEQQLERGEAPMMRHVAPVMSLVEHLPPGLCERLLALPVRRDPRTGTIDVAVVDARDTHAVAEVAYWLKAPVRMVRTSLVSMDAALRRMRKPEDAPGMRSLAPPIWVPAPSERPRPRAETPVYGSPAVGAQPKDASDGEAPAPPESAREQGLNIPFALKRKDSPGSQADPSNDGTSAAPPRRGQDLDGTSAAPPRRGQDLDTPAEDPVLDLRVRKGTPVVGSQAAALTQAARDIARLVRDIREAADRDAILELLAQGARVVADKVAVLAVKRGVLAGWTCSPEMADRAHFRQVKVSTLSSAVLSEALDSGTARVARIPKDAAHAPLLAALRDPLMGESALVAVRVDGKSVALVLAADVGADTRTACRQLEELAVAAGDALSELLRTKRK
jgi:hypothetical protein